MLPLDPCCGILVTAIPSIGIARIVLAPAFNAAKRSRLPVRYHVTDLAVLVAYVSLSLGLGYTPWADMLDPSGRLLPIASLALLSACLWWIGVRTLSNAGITRAQQRLAFLMVVPFVYVSAAAVIPLALFSALALVAISDGHVIGFPYFVILIGIPSATVALIAGRLIARRIFQVPCG